MAQLAHCAVTVPESLFRGLRGSAYNNRREMVKSKFTSWFLASTYSYPLGVSSFRAFFINNYPPLRIARGVELKTSSLFRMFLALIFIREKLV
jgi:hypothetical protein